MSQNSSTVCITQLQRGMNLQQTLSLHFGKLIVLIFSAQWNKEALHFKTKMISSIKLFGQFANVAYISASAEDYPQVFRLFSVEYVPTVIFTDPLTNLIKRFETEDQAAILDALPEQSENYRIYFEKQRKYWCSKIQTITKQSSVVLFSNSSSGRQTERLSTLLNKYNVKFNLHNILQDRKMSSWLKYYTNNQSFPLLFANQQFLGDAKICFELEQKGQFLLKIPKSCLPIDIKQTFQGLITNHKIILFTDKLSFQNTEEQALINKLNLPSSQVSIYNLTINLKLKQLIHQNYQKQLPLLFVQGQLHS